MKGNLINEVITKVKGSKSNKFMKVAQVCGTAAIMMTVATPVFAATDTSSVDSIITFFADWLTKIGLAVAFFGGCQTGFAFKNDDSDGKSRGLHTVASGLIVAGVCAARNAIFGI